MRSTGGFRRTLRTVNRSLPTEQCVKLEEVGVDSKIPTKYFIVQSFPIFPQDYSNKGHKIYFDDGKWNVVLWPSNTSNFKDEIRYLSDAVDIMIDDIEIADVDQEHPERTKLQILTQKAELLEIALDELNRQVSRENKERGELMKKIVDLFTGVVGDIPNVYNKIIDGIGRDHERETNNLREENEMLSKKERDANDELRSQKILLEMQNQWHDDLEVQIDEWKENIRSFNEKLTSELKKQKDEYEEQLSDLQVKLKTVSAERDGYKSQIDWEQKTLQEKELKVLAIEQELASNKALLEEREQMFYSTRAQFQRQITFMKEQMGQITKSGTPVTIENVNNITQMLPPRYGEPLPLLTLEEVNRRIMDIYVSKVRHDSAYSEGTEPPLFKFVIKYHIATMFGYKPSVNKIWQFMNSCDKYKYESLNVTLFMRQIEEENSDLKVIQYMATLVKKEGVGENGIPRLSIGKYKDLASRLLHDNQLDNLEHLLEKKIINPKRGAFVDFDIFLQILLDLIADKNHAYRQRIIFQFREILTKDSTCEYPAFGEFVSRFAPHISGQKIGDLFLEAMQSSLPSMAVTEQAFQLLVYRGAFEEFKIIMTDDLEVANPEEMAQFVNSRWKTDLADHVNSALVQLRTEKMAECHKLYVELSRIAEHMKLTCTVKDAGSGISLLHRAAILLIRLKFLNTARKDSADAQKELRRLIDIVWN